MARRAESIALLSPRPRRCRPGTNTQFDAARAGQALGFVADNTHHADYNTTVNSWVEQRTFVTQAPALLRRAYPALAANLTSALDALAHPTVPTPAAGMGAVASPVGKPLQCGGWTVKLGASGAMASLVHSSNSSVDWASESEPIGEFKYQTFTSGDFNIFLKDFASRIGDRGVWPEHTAGKYAEYNYSTSDMTCGNVRRPTCTSAPCVPCADADVSCVLR